MSLEQLQQKVPTARFIVGAKLVSKSSNSLLNDGAAYLPYITPDYVNIRLTGTESSAKSVSANVEIYYIE